ncbi:MAG: hypothetical protein IKY74_06035 [Alistipes sp.]|nr:hypothetical protein [Alistipes sp.]
MKPNNKNIPNKENIVKPYIIHMWWSITILSLLLIASISFIFSERVVNADNLAEYISFASVLLSITLSIFAILYTYTSNVQIQEQFNKIDCAASNINDVSYKLHDVSSRLNDSLTDITTTLANLDKGQQELNKKVSDRNSILTNMGEILKDINNSES